MQTLNMVHTECSVFSAHPSSRRNKTPRLARCMWTMAALILLALLAACCLSPGTYFAVNAPPALAGTTPAAVVSNVSGWGCPVSEAEMSGLASAVGEKTLYGRVGGAP